VRRGRYAMSVLQCFQSRQPAAAWPRSDAVLLPPLDLIVPARRVRRIDDAQTSLLKAGDCSHFGIAQIEVEYRQISGELVGLGRARNWDDPLLDEITQCDLRGALPMRARMSLPGALPRASGQ
jgi:hypothetical protein